MELGKQYPFYIMIDDDWIRLQRGILITLLVQSWEAKFSGPKFFFGLCVLGNGIPSVTVFHHS